VIEGTKDTKGIERIKILKGINVLKAAFETLWVWQEAHKLMLIAHGIANKLPKSIEKEKIDQIKRSSSSVADNIAEGYSSYYYNEKIKGMYTARKEAGETQNHLKAINAKGYLDEIITDELISRYQKLIIGINSFAKYIGEKRDASKHPK
jgi:four helix bundle protein